ncbi:MAG: acyloxyacyl hydrolase [Pseudomonadota bacterium]
MPVFAFLTASAMPASAGETHLSFGFRSVDNHEDAEIYARRITDRRVGPLNLAYGGALTEEGAVWVGVGLQRDWVLSGPWYVSASVMPGLRDRGGGPDLGHTVQIRSGLEIGRQFGAGALGIGIDHISNAGLGEDNPGSNALFLRYRLPVR